ncbi:hypothetical protein Phou_036140 [Phytohabitans houttuyneae]|uniref:ParB/Sulfiredoxin domain-containing protein n=1 Tax=Phytohabitans houttuyneae TaxID=1076126 RepID=A0A6V8K6P9_9ACTN|nr:hypothetical protein Phou_036140 [Phytohabitans houttuyneae]
MGTYVMRSYRVRDFAPALHNGDVRPAATAGGPSWDVAARTALLASLERRWPIGTLTAWAPPGGVTYLLDGHRRAGCIAALLGATTLSATSTTQIRPTCTRTMSSPAARICPRVFCWRRCRSSPPSGAWRRPRPTAPTTSPPR